MSFRNLCGACDEKQVKCFRFVVKNEDENKHECVCGHFSNQHVEAATLTATSSASVLPPNDPFSLFWSELTAGSPIDVGLSPLPPFANPVGHLITLTSAYMFGQHILGKHFYVRPCYSGLLTAIQTQKSAGFGGVLITGIPGIGKSFFAAYLMRHYYNNGATIVYQHSQGKKRWLLAPTGPIQRGGLDAFIDNLQLPTSIYICDVGGDGSAQPDSSSDSFAVVLASPDPAHYKEWLKKTHTTLYMPMWTEEEIAAVVPTIFPQRFLSDGVTSIFPKRFKLYGGVPRTIFDLHDDNYLEDALKRMIEACNLTKLQQSIQSNSRIDSMKLLNFTLSTNTDGSFNYTKVPIINFASDKIEDLVITERELRDAADIVSFLQGAIGKPDLHSMAGKVFERRAHRVLSKAMFEFKYRLEDDEKHTEHAIRFPTTQLKGIVADLTNLKDNEYARLLKSNYPTIDAVIKLPQNRIYLFQMTVSLTHSVNLPGLNKVVAELGVTGVPCFLVMAVPPFTYPEFQHTAGSMLPAGSVMPDNITIIVLEIPLTLSEAEKQQAVGIGGGKRKVEDATFLAPPAKKPVSTQCNCSSGCHSNRCECHSHGHKCGSQCHKKSASSSAHACSNC